MVFKPETFPNMCPTKSSMPKPTSKKMKILPFYGWGVGVYESVSFRQGLYIIMCLFQKIQLSKSCPYCNFFFGKPLMCKNRV